MTVGVIGFGAGVLAEAPSLGSSTLLVLGGADTVIAGINIIKSGCF
jgi:hypothetical protein